MNIMLVSITERTKEIGVRMALGAKRGIIRQQFVIEAIMLCLIGGVIGILDWRRRRRIARSGCGLCHPEYVLGVCKLHYYGSASVGNGDHAFIVLLYAYGCVFGYYPANKAAKMEVIDALRYE